VDTTRARRCCKDRAVSCLTSSLRASSWLLNFLAGGTQVGSQKPLDEVELGVLEDRAGGHAGLLAALVTLEQVPGLDQAPVVVLAASWAGEAVLAPSGLAQALPAGVFGAVLVVEFQQARGVAYAGGSGDRGLSRLWRTVRAVTTLLNRPKDDF